MVDQSVNKYGRTGGRASSESKRSRQSETTGERACNFFGTPKSVNGDCSCRKGRKGEKKALVVMKAKTTTTIKTWKVRKAMQDEFLGGRRERPMLGED